MTRCFFNFRQGAAYSVDEEGCEFDTVESAYLAAVRAAQDIWRELLIQREDPLLCAFDVTDANGNDLFCLPFSEVLDACAGRTPLPSAPKIQNPVAQALEYRRRATRAISGMSVTMKETNATLRETIGLLAEVSKVVDS